ncbi:MAG: hypothetical protein JRJ29_01510 [Deltaproteobacteria bacterium]|nr:hypothetical protein [Deltaproteobacteria bacterium]
MFTYEDSQLLAAGVLYALSGFLCAYFVSSPVLKWTGTILFMAGVVFITVLLALFLGSSCVSCYDPAFHNLSSFIAENPYGFIAFILGVALAVRIRNKPRRDSYSQYR